VSSILSGLYARRPSGPYPKNRTSFVVRLVPYEMYDRDPHFSFRFCTFRTMTYIEVDEHTG